MLKRLLSVLLILGLLTTASAQNASSATAVADLLDSTLEDLLNSESLIPGESSSDWAALLAARYGHTGGRSTYLNGLWDYVSRQYQETGGLDRVKATLWHRISLVILALGADPTCFGTDKDGAPINLIADGTYNWTATDSLGTQGLNAWIYALLVLDAGNFAVPQDALYQREDMIAAILAAQELDGGFGLSAGTSDTDITAMALQALAPYRQTHQAAIDRALDYLSSAQTARGDFETWGVTSAESCAQVIIALCSLGIDPRTDVRFVKDGGSALDGLLLYRDSSGAFSHTLEDTPDLLATEQACLSLCALERMDAGQGRLYDFTDTEILPFEAAPASAPPIPLYCIGGGILLLCAIIVLVWKGKKKCTESPKRS